MESRSAEPRVLQELAYTYIALAHGADGELSDEEIDQIATRLKGWEFDAVQTVTSALKEALDSYLSDSSVERLDAAVATVREAFADELRARLMDDLVEIALADGKFLFREGSFIERVARILEVRIGEADRQRRPSWSVLAVPHASDEGWTAVHDLALIFVTLAHRTDNDLSVEEIEVIARKLNEWLPEAHEDDVLQIVQDVLGTYAQGHNDQIYDEAVEAVRTRVPRHQIPALLDDLRSVAAADGEILDEERLLMAQLASAWQADTAPLRGK